MVTIVWGATKKPISSERLTKFFSDNPHLDGSLYIGYPVIGTPEGAFPIDALWVNKDKGVVLFNLVEGRALSDYDLQQDDSANKLEAKLRNHRMLMKGRSLKVSITPITFSPLAAKITQKIDGYSLCDEYDLLETLESIPDDEQAYEEVLSVIQSISTIRKGKKRRPTNKVNSKGSILKTLEDSIANLDNLQGKAVIETVEGVQRIRGLAGSGKTIVLALKAAYLHAQHPDWKIAVTFHTRALKGQFRRLINTFCIEQTLEEPDWENIDVINSWGAAGTSDRNGIYYTFCKLSGVEYLDLKAAKARFRGDELSNICKIALEQAPQIEPIYDVILVDEAQDLSASFLNICYRLLKDPKRLVYAYDELQNLGGASLPPPEDIFGSDTNGQPLVSFAPQSERKPTQDIILEKCYRNSRPVLATAHALGFGIYREPDKGQTTGLIQMFDQRDLWLDVGYKVLSGELEEDKTVRLGRTDESSPKFLETHSDVDDIVQFHSFGSFEEQDIWLAEAIGKNISDDELQPDDIIVINPDPLTTRSAVGSVRKILYEKNIQTHLAGVDTSPDVFFDDDGESIAFTGIYRAKGNEAGMVYIINAQDCFFSWMGSATARNRLFTAITRSKAWVRVLGVGQSMNLLIEEFKKAKGNDFELEFRYPTAEERKNLTIVNRDKDTGRIKDGSKKLGKLIDDLQSGKVFLEDLPAEQVNALKDILLGSKK